MEPILSRILREKRREVERLRQSAPIEPPRRAGAAPSLAERLLERPALGVIAEIKRASPSKGAIQLDVNPAAQARLYEAGGAVAISVLTDEAFFQGSFADLRAAKEAVAVPILCKDFLIDPLQIARAQAAGADAVLLIAAALSRAELERLYYCAGERGLDVLLEVHDEAEMERALAIGARWIGINNRDLKTFAVDLATTERLLGAYARPGVAFVAESGVRTAGDAERVQAAGAHAALVGEALMSSADPTALLRSLQIRRGGGADAN